MPPEIIVVAGNVAQRSMCVALDSLVHVEESGEVSLAAEHFRFVQDCGVIASWHEIAIFGVVDESKIHDAAA